MLRREEGEEPDTHHHRGEDDHGERELEEDVEEDPNTRNPWISACKEYTDGKAKHEGDQAGKRDREEVMLKEEIYPWTKKGITGEIRKFRCRAPPPKPFGICFV